MQVQTNSSYAYSNSFGSSTYSPPLSFKEISLSGEIDQLKDDFSMISHELNPSERKLYNTLVYEENYQAAKGIVTVGFMRAAGIYHDSEGEPLSGTSLTNDLNKLFPPNAPEEQKALTALQNYLISNPESLAINQAQRGNLLDLRI